LDRPAEFILPKSPCLKREDGLGFVMQVYLQTLEYRRLATVLLHILVVVLAMDGLNALVRKRFLLTAQA
jgi:ABC-type phosphate/phosphonate transport system permease subunit